MFVCHPARVSMRSGCLMGMFYCYTVLAFVVFLPRVISGDSDFQDHENTGGVKEESPVKAKNVRRSGRAKKGAAPPTPLSDIGNSPRRGRRLRG